MRETEVLAALQEAYSRAGTQGALAKKAGVSQGRIADYLNQRCAVGNMTVSVFLRLFPDMSIDFFGETPAINDPMREELLCIFDALGPRDRARCLALLAAHFGDKLREELPQPVKKVAGRQVS